MGTTDDMSGIHGNWQPDGWCQAVVDGAADAIITIDGGLIIRGINRAGEAFFGTSRKGLLGRSLTEFLRPDEKRPDSDIGKLLAPDETPIELLGIRAGGTIVPVQVSLVCPAYGFDGLYALFLRDLSGKRKAEDFAQAQYQILEMISESQPIGQIMISIARLIEEQMPDSLCSILLVKNDRELYHVAGPSLPVEYCESINGAFIGEMAGSCGTAAHRKQIVIVEDIATDPLWDQYRLIAMRHNLRSCWSTPLISGDGTVLGTFALYRRERHSPAPDEMEMVAAVSHLAMLGLLNEHARTVLGESEQRFRSVLESSQDASYRYNIQTCRFDYVSPVVYRLLGYTAEEFLGWDLQEFLELILPEDRSQAAATAQALESGELSSGQTQCRIIAKDGHYRWIRDNFTLVVDDARGKRYCVGSLQDVTAQKEAEEALQRSNERLSRTHEALTSLTSSLVLQSKELGSSLHRITETVAETLNVPRVSIWRFNRDKTSLVCQDLFELSLRRHTSGYELRRAECPQYLEAICQSHVLSADHARTDPRTVEFNGSYLGPQAIHSKLDATMQRVGGADGVLCLEQTGYPRRWRQDEQMFTIAVANLLSMLFTQWELSKAEMAMRKSEANLAAAQRIAHLGSWAWDLATGEQQWSEEIYHMFGLSYQKDEARNDLFLNCVHPEDRPKLIAVLDKAIAEDLEYKLEYRLIRPSGEEVVIQEQAEVERDSNGKALRITGTCLDITQRKRAEERLMHEALHDGLTGLANRTLLTDHMDAAFLRFKRHNDRLFALILADLDRFKNVNDSLGHPSGDLVLVETARRFKSASRAGDTIARLGGDEFAILLEDIEDEEASTRVAQRVLAEMEQPFQVGDTTLEMSISIGVVVVTTQHSSTDQIFSDADIALYRAKDAGRGTYQLFDQEMHRRILERLELEADLRHAVGRSQLTLFLQPVVALSTGIIQSFEALLRWQHPVKGFVSPEVFIPLAEESRLIVGIGNWVTREACRIIREWPQGQAPPISINVSPVQMLNNTQKAIGSVGTRQSSASFFNETFGEMITQEGIDPNLLRVEITESVLIGDTTHIKQVLDKLVQAGFKLLLDDFGTGYSSLSYLQDLPFYQVKLDRAFTAKLVQNTRSHDLMKGIITLAHNLGLQVIAEGVETEEQLSLLREAGCDLVQGYLISRPMPVGDAQHLYISGRRW